MVARAEVVARAWALSLSVWMGRPVQMYCGLRGVGGGSLCGEGEEDYLAVLVEVAATRFWW